jgi:hypothetical protein
MDDDPQVQLINGSLAALEGMQIGDDRSAREAFTQVVATVGRISFLSARASAQAMVGPGAPTGDILGQLGKWLDRLIGVMTRIVAELDGAASFSISVGYQRVRDPGVRRLGGPATGLRQAGQAPQVDAGYPAGLDEDHEQVVAVAATDDRAKAVRVHRQLGHRPGGPARRAGPHGRRHLGAEHLDQQAADGVAVEDVVFQRLHQGPPVAPNRSVLIPSGG